MMTMKLVVKWDGNPGGDEGAPEGDTLEMSSTIRRRGCDGDRNGNTSASIGRPRTVRVGRD